MNVNDFYDITPENEARLNDSYNQVKKIMGFSAKLNEGIHQIVGSHSTQVAALANMSSLLNQFNNLPDETNNDELSLAKHSFQSLKEIVDKKIIDVQDLHLRLQQVLENIPFSDRQDYSRFEKMFSDYQAKKKNSLTILEKHQKQSAEDLNNSISSLQLIQDYSEARQEEQISGVNLFSRLKIYEQKHRPRNIQALTSVLKLFPHQSEEKEILFKIAEANESVLDESKNFEVAQIEQASELLRINSSKLAEVNIEKQTGWLWVLSKKKMEKSPNWFEKVLPSAWKRFYCSVEDNVLFQSEFSDGSYLKTVLLESLHQIDKINKVTGGKRNWCLELILEDGRILTLQCESEDDLESWVKVLSINDLGTIEVGNDESTETNLFTQIGAKFAKIEADVKKSVSKLTLNAELDPEDEIYRIDLLFISNDTVEITPDDFKKSPKSFEVIAGREWMKFTEKENTEGISKRISINSEFLTIESVRKLTLNTIFNFEVQNNVMAVIFKGSIFSEKYSVLFLDCSLAPSCIQLINEKVAVAQGREVHDSKPGEQNQIDDDDVPI